MKVVGYYNSFSRTQSFEKLFLDPLDYINYSFLIPREDGNTFFYDEENVKKVVSFSHNCGKKVFVSVGGYYDKEKVLSKVFESICSDNSKYQLFISSVIKVVDDYDFDGVDIDWEYPTIEFLNSFEQMLDDLQKILHFKKKKLTIAIHNALTNEKKWCRVEAITDSVVNKVDWLNIMTYDATEDGNHSSLRRCIRCFEYWHDVRKVPKEKILIGAAFYARLSEKPYYKLIEEDKSNYFRDFYKDDTFNGCYTIKEKTYFARLNCGGLIIWAINYDTFDETSLLRVINEAL